MLYPVVSAISRRGGFGPKAWPDRVLVVRGSLDKPQPIVINVKKVLAGEEKDFKLEPRDIVYISDRPWAKAEEILVGGKAPQDVPIQGLSRFSLIVNMDAARRLQAQEVGKGLQGTVSKRFRRHRASLATACGPQRAALKFLRSPAQHAW